MKRREWLAAAATLSSVAALGGLTGCAAPVLRGTGDLGVVIGRANGTLYLIDTSTRALIGEVPGLGDLSHASVVFSRDGRFAYVFGRDGGLTMVDLLTQRITRRVMQAGNAIGGAISADGTLVAAQNYTPGGVKVFDARTLDLVADVPAEYAPGKLSRVVGLVDLPGRRFAYSLFDADAIWVTDCSDPKQVTTQKFKGIGRQPYDALVTPDGRHYIAGLFGEDGLAMLDLWAADPKSSASSAATAKARRRCRSTRCRTCAAGPWLGAAPICPPSAGTRCWWSIPTAGRRWAAYRSPASRCS